MGYGLFLAKIVAASGKYTEDIGDRIQVRVLPQMESIEPSKCPLWPYFFKDQLYTGKQGDLVWVVCNDEFSVGYVLGPANYTTYESDDYGKYSVPGELKEIVEKVTVKLKGKKFSFNDVKVTFWNRSCIHLVKRSNGTMVIAFANGTLYMFGPDEFLINIGESSLALNAEKGFSVNTSEVKLFSNYVGLGKNPSGNVLISQGATSKAAQISKTVEA